MANMNPKIIVSENSQPNDSAFAKNISVNNLFEGAEALAANPKVESVEITKFSDLVIKLQNDPGKIHVINYNASVAYINCTPKHVSFVAINFPKIKSLANLNLF